MTEQTLEKANELKKAEDAANNMYVRATAMRELKGKLHLSCYPALSTEDDVPVPKELADTILDIIEGYYDRLRWRYSDELGSL